MAENEFFQWLSHFELEDERFYKIFNLFSRLTKSNKQIIIIHIKNAQRLNYVEDQLYNMAVQQELGDT